jgi:GMP synthase (glutamine-hydrolysing)
MYLFRNMRLLKGALLVVLLCLAPATGLFAADKASGDTELNHKARRPWLMIGLSPDGCSRGCRHLFSVIKNLSGNPNGIIEHFSRITLDYLLKTQPEFMVLSPQGTPWCRYTGANGVELQNFLWVLPVAAEELNIPILGVCGGHQALALAFGGKVGPIRAGEFDCMPYSKERQGGVVPLTVTAPDPIFRGTDGSLRIVMSHYDEVKVLPPGFVLLASEKVSPNQIIRHPSRPVYGIQGHPEHFHTGQPDGGVLIRNFLKIAGMFNETVRHLQRAEPKLLSFRRPGDHLAAY